MPDGLCITDLTWLSIVCVAQAHQASQSPDLSRMLQQMGHPEQGANPQAAAPSTPPSGKGKLPLLSLHTAAAKCRNTQATCFLASRLMP